jgi:hypothetical protein
VGLGMRSQGRRDVRGSRRPAGFDLAAPLCCVEPTRDYNLVSAQQLAVDTGGDHMSLKLVSTAAFVVLVLVSCARPSAQPITLVAMGTERRPSTRDSD